MNSSRLDYLFGRYWDNSLLEEEFAELVEILREDPAARSQFRFHCHLAVAVSDHPHPEPEIPVVKPVGPVRTPISRRKMLAYSGVGLVAGAAGLALLSDRAPHSLPGLRTSPISPPRLISIYGNVRVTPSAGSVANEGQILMPGSLVSSRGLGSGVEIGFPGGNWVTLAADTTAVIGSGGTLILQSGTALARMLPTQGIPGVLSTPEAEFSSPGGASLSLERKELRTQVGVQEEALRVSTSTTAFPTELQEGEQLVVQANGQQQKTHVKPTTEEYSWSIQHSLTSDWGVGYIQRLADRYVVRPQWWYDPYHSTSMWQIRSDNAWNQGHVILWPDSRVRVKYRVDRPGMSQVVLVVRALRHRTPQCGVLEINGAFDRAEPGQWMQFDADAGTMLHNRHAPSFDPPWVGFLGIINTFEKDLGLCVSEFRVTRPRTPRL